MTFSRIVNLLSQMQDRLGRMKKAFATEYGWDEQQDFHTALDKLVERIATYRERPSLLKIDAIDRIRDDILGLRAFNISSFFDQRRELEQLRRNIQADCDWLSNAAILLQIGLGQVSPQDIASLIPGQKPAAYQFDFEVDRLIVVDQIPRIAEQEVLIIKAARDFLVDQGSRILTELRSSNCSPKLIDSFSILHERFLSEHNIILLGMSMKPCSHSAHSQRRRTVRFTTCGNESSSFGFVRLPFTISRLEDIY